MHHTETPSRTWFNLQVVSKQSVAQDIVAFELALTDGGDLPVFTAGAHIQVLTPSGVQRNYSLYNDPAERHRYCIAVKRDAAGRGGSVSMADSLQIGHTLPVRNPDNAFALHPRAKRFLFIAGGIGITPMMAMLQEAQVSHAGAFKLVYCTRNQGSTAFADTLIAPHIRSKVTLHHDHGDPSAAFDFWPLLEKPVAGTHIYSCGPRKLMDAVKDMSGHWPFGSVHFESFGVDAALRQTNRAFDITLQSTGQTVHVDAHTSMLDALRAQHIPVRSSCESGTCGSCKTVLVSGACEHRDYVLSEQETQTHVMVCVSRAAAGSSLVLGL